MKKSPLPSTPDEIPSSEIRRHPLTPEELHDIRSLIGSAKNSSSNNNNSSLTQRPPPQPLAGRRVMIPITSKAFFEGTLQPSTKNVLNISTATNNAMQEQIIMNVGGGKFEEMTRARARDFLEKQEMKKEKEKKSVKSSLKSDRKFSVAPSSKATTATTTTTTTTTPTPTPNDDTPSSSTTEQQSPSSLPLIEIRETHDPNGQILNSEVVNMSNTMQRLGNSMKHVDNTGDTDDDGKELGQILARTLKSAEEDIIKLDTKKLISFANSKEETTTTTTTTTPKQQPAAKKKTTNKKKEAPISEADYEALCTRLEELERMEEEDAMEKRSSVKSSKRLQSGGWGKGFLNGGSTTKKGGKQKQKQKQQQRQQRQQQIGGGTKERLGAKGAYGTVKERIPVTMVSQESESTAAATAAATAMQEIEHAGINSSSSSSSSIPSTTNNASSRVSFSGSNQIKEIPRIGQSKVPPRPMATTTTTSATRGRTAPNLFNPFSQTATNDVEEIHEVADPFGQVSQPFEEKVFRGVVKERGGGNDAAATSSLGNSGGEDGGGGAGGKKKLSRFAQQRLQRG